MKKQIATAACLLLTATVGVGSVNAQTLEEVLAYAYNNNPSLIAQRSQLRAVDESVPIARSGWRPVVQANASVGQQWIDSELQGSDTPTPADVSVSVSQPLYDGGVTAASVNQAEANVLAGRALLAATEQAVLLDAAAAYLNVVRDQAVLDLSIRNVEVLQRQLEAAQDRFRVGEITRTDVAQAEARLAGALADRAQAEGNLQASRAAFAQVVGVQPGELEAPMAVEVEPENLEAAVELARRNNPGVIEARYRSIAATHGIEAIRGELRPSLTVNGSASYNIQDVQEAGDTWSEAVAVTLNVNVPLYQAGAVRGRVRQQKHLANESILRVEAARRTAVENAKQAWEALQAAEAQVESLSAQIEAADIALRGVEREAEVGARTVLDVLDAQLELFSAQVNLVVARRDLAVTAFQLKQAIGLLTAQGLGLPVEAYDPSAHYEIARGRWLGTDIEPVMATEQLVK